METIIKVTMDQLFINKSNVARNKKLIQRLWIRSLSTYLRVSLSISFGFQSQARTAGWYFGQVFSGNRLQESRLYL
jgi:hypothetical protein